MDFRIPGLPHSAVKDAQNTSVRELIQKIEEPPRSTRSSTRSRQIKQITPFSPESKKMIQDVGNIELCELVETEPKTQCTACLSNWDIGIVNCTCGAFLAEGNRGQSKFVKYTMDLFQSLSMSSRREDFMDIDMVKSRETKNIIRITN